MTMLSIYGMIMLLGIMSVIVVVIVIVIASVTKSEKKEEDESDVRPYYQKQNQVSEKASSTSLVIVYLIIIVGFVVFGVTSIAMSNSIKSFENQLNGMNYTLMQSNNQINDLYHRINELKQADDYVERFTYEMKEVTSEGEGVLEVKVYMRKLPSDGAVSLVLENSESDVTITELISDSMILSVNVNVSLDQSYNVAIVLQDDVEVIREELTTIHLQNLMYKYRGIKVEEDWDQSGFTFMFTVYNNYALHEMMAFEEVWIEIYEGDRLISTRLLTVPDVMINDYQEFCFDVFIGHEDDVHQLIKVRGIDYFGHEYVMFHEGW